MHIQDFSNISIKTLEVNPIGWVNPLTIEYGEVSIHKEFCWRIKGTKHTFVIPTSRVYFLSNGDYAKHFEEVLEKFATLDYETWKKTGFVTDWMREYQEEYRNYIL